MPVRKQHTTRDGLVKYTTQLNRLLAFDRDHRFLDLDLICPAGIAELRVADAEESWRPGSGHLSGLKSRNRGLQH